jgi:drug/metabolite transporter (DMT)-like permease
LDLLAIVALAMAWGLNWPAVRTVLYEIEPWTFRAVGLGAGALFLFVVAGLRGQRLFLRREELAPVLVGGFFNVTAFNMLLAFAQLAAPTSRAVIVTFTMPIWTVIFARLFLGERLDGRRALGLGFGVAGLVALGWPLISAGSFSVGRYLALLAGVSWALGTIVMKRFPTATPPMTLMAWQLAGASLVAAVGMVLFEPETLTAGIAWSQLRAQTWIALFHHIVLSQSLAYVIWYRLLSRLPAGTVSLSTLMVPAIGVVSSVLFLGETPTLADFAGLALMTAAAGAVMAPTRRPQPG